MASATSAKETRPLLRLEQVSVTLGRTRILSNVSLTVNAGDIVGLMGPNGSGKTTLLSVLAGLIIPACGSITRRGDRANGKPCACGLMFEHPSFMEQTSGRKNLARWASLLGIDTAPVESALRDVGLDPVNRTAVKRYSQGMRKRLAFAQALLDNPPLLLLDEPMNGLDPEGIMMMRKRLQNHACEGGAIVISSHLLSELARICTSVYMVVRGTVTPICPFDGTTERLEAAYRSYIEPPDAATEEAQ